MSSGRGALRECCDCCCCSNAISTSSLPMWHSQYQSTYSFITESVSPFSLSGRLARSRWTGEGAFENTRAVVAVVSTGHGRLSRSRSPHKLVWPAHHRCSNAKYVGGVASDATCARGVACGNGRIETTLKRWISVEIYGSNSK